MRLILTSLFIICYLAPFCQTTFHKIYGDASNDVAYSILQAPNGDYIIGGMTISFGVPGDAPYILKINQAGDTLWTRIISNLSGQIRSIKKTTDGGYIVTTGRLLIKLSSAGDLTWSRDFYFGNKPQYFTSAIQTADGGYALTGGTENAGSGYYDVYLVKTNATGNMQWTKTYGSPKYEYGSSIEQTADGGFLLSGITTDTSLGPRGNVYLIKTDAGGDTLWTKVYKDTNLEEYPQTLSVPGGYLILVGGFSAIYLIKTDLSGNIIWAKSYDDVGQNAHNAKNIFQTADGNYMMICNLGGGSYGTDMYLIKVNSNGDVIWTKKYQGAGISPSPLMSGAGQQTSDGGYIIAGAVNSNNALTQISVIKTDTGGNSVCPSSDPVLSVAPAVFQPISRVTSIASGGMEATPTITIIYGGTTANYCPLDVQDAYRKQSLLVYPNPFENKITLKGTERGGMIIIGNMFGQEILRCPALTEETTVNLEAMAPQFYYLNYISERAEAHFKIIKK